MSEVTYTKSKGTDFGGSISPYQFHQEIEGESSIATTILRVDTNDDVVDIVFSGTLSGAEESALNTLISNHTAIETAKRLIATLTPRNNQFKTTAYSRVVTFIYKGSNYTTPLGEVSFISNKDSNVTSYTVRGVAGTTVLFEETYTNTTETINTVAIPAHLVPTSTSKLEFQIKKNGGSGNSAVYCESVYLSS